MSNGVIIWLAGLASPLDKLQPQRLDLITNPSATLHFRRGITRRRGASTPDFTQRGIFHDPTCSFMRCICRHLPVELNSGRGAPYSILAPSSCPSANSQKLMRLRCTVEGALNPLLRVNPSQRRECKNQRTRRIHHTPRTFYPSVQGGEKNTLSSLTSCSGQVLGRAWRMPIAS